VDEATEEDILWCDGIAVGSPTQFGILSAKMKQFWDQVAGGVWGQVDGKIACAFASSGGWGGGAELTNLSTLLLLMNFGFLVFGVPDYVGEAFTLHYGAIAAREPDQRNEAAACERLGTRLAQWVDAFADGRSHVNLGPVSDR
jgi:NAD(P)H dehydrogenase (quinone)